MSCDFPPFLPSLRHHLLLDGNLARRRQVSSSPKGSLSDFGLQIASTKGGSLSTEVILTLGFANLIADAISMGLGDFLSSKAEYDHLVAEKKREAWEFENYPEGECKEMVEVRGCVAAAVVLQLSQPQ